MTYPDMFGYFISIRKHGVPRLIARHVAYWGADNECFNNKFVPDEFIRWLTTLHEYKRHCLFIAAPDVVADASATLKKFSYWRDVIHEVGLPVALVLQDGMTTQNIPWGQFDAVFVGGSTEWKLSEQVIEILTAAGKLGLWRHVGRVNSLTRMSHFWGFADSFDGTGFAIEPDGKLRAFVPHMLARKYQRRLF